MNKAQAIAILREMAAANRRQAEAIEVLLVELGERPAGSAPTAGGGSRPERPFTPETLAERWSCTARHVRQEVSRGNLAAFRSGSLIRISATAVADYEARKERQEEPALPDNEPSPPPVADESARIKAVAREVRQLGKSKIKSKLRKT